MINTAIWGEPNTWQLMATLQNADFDEGEWLATYNAKIKYSSEVPTLYDGVDDEKLSMEIPIPKDVTFWGINKNAAYVKNWYITPIKNGTDIIHSNATDSLPVTEEIEELDYVPFILYYNSHDQQWIPPYGDVSEQPRMPYSISSSVLLLEWKYDFSRGKPADKALYISPEDTTSIPMPSSVIIS